MKNIFVTDSRVPPSRWLQAFPDAGIVSSIPVNPPEGTLIWLHNMTPTQSSGKTFPQGVKFVVMYDEPSDVTGLAALSQGAVGYCNAHATPELLLTIASVIANNGLWVGESLLNRLIGGINARVPGEARMETHPLLASLSSREKEVAIRVARGESNKEIARQINLAERTVKAHLTAVFDKLGVRDRLQLALLLITPAR